jgi:hypothetical protein
MRKFLLLFSMVLFAGSQLFAQSRNVTGTVTGPDGAPLVGALVIVKGTNTNALTETNGRYTISAPSNGVLTVSLLGMLSQEVPVSGRTTIDIRLESDTQVIDDVVVDRKSVV